MPRVTNEEMEVEGHGGMGLRKHETSYEPGTELHTVKYIQSNHLCSKLRTVPAI